MKNLVAQKWIDECGTLFPIDGNTVLYPTPGSGIFELYQGKGQDKRIGLKNSQKSLNLITKYMM